MPLLKKQFFPARRFLAPAFMREVHAKLTTSHAFGSSIFARLPRLMRLVLAKQQDPKTIIAPDSIPPVPKIAKTAGQFRRRKRKPGRPPYKAQPAELYRDASNRAYLRLSNGQVVRAQNAGAGSLYARIPSGPVTLKPSDQLALTKAL